MKWITTFAAMALALVASGHAQQRVVSVGGDVTEIIYAVGAGDLLVATDSTSVFPEEALQTPKVGYVRRLSAEGVLSVEPDLIIISGAAGPETALEQIVASGVPIISLETTYTMQSVLTKIDTVAKAVGRESEGRGLRAEVEEAITEAKTTIEDLDIQPTALFFSSPPSTGGASAAGDNTAAAGLIEAIGGSNVFAGRPGYKPLSLEAALAADPDLIFVMSHHADGLGGLEQVINHPAIALTTAAQEGRVFLVDPVTVMQFGPRTPRAIADLAIEVADVLGD